jgi:hypothetical protein
VADKDPTTTSDKEDVEAHGLLERPSAEQPSAEASSEDPDFEAHGLMEKPSMERPSAE